MMMLTNHNECAVCSTVDITVNDCNVKCKCSDTVHAGVMNGSVVNESSVVVSDDPTSNENDNFADMRIRYRVEF